MTVVQKLKSQYEAGLWSRREYIEQLNRLYRIDELINQIMAKQEHHMNGNK
jgi:enolase